MARQKAPKVRGTWTTEQIVELGLNVLGDEAKAIAEKHRLDQDDMRRLLACVRGALDVMKERREQAGAKKMPSVPDAQLIEAMVQAIAEEYRIAPGAVLAFLRSNQPSAS